MSLVANKDYKRRISWLILDQTISDIAVYEYVGQHATGDVHGNAKEGHQKEPYVRTPAATMDIIAARTKTDRVQNVYTELIVNPDINAAPRDSRVVRNKKNERPTSREGHEWKSDMLKFRG